MKKQISEEFLAKSITTSFRFQNGVNSVNYKCLPLAREESWVGWLVFNGFLLEGENWRSQICTSTELFTSPLAGYLELGLVILEWTLLASLVSLDPLH